jgi:Ca2+/Na+ antiporter
LFFLFCSCARLLSRSVSSSNAMLLLLLLASFAAVRAVPNVPRYVRSIPFVFVLHLFLLAHRDCTHTFLLACTPLRYYCQIVAMLLCFALSAIVLREINDVRAAAARSRRARRGAHRSGEALGARDGAAGGDRAPAAGRGRGVERGARARSSCARCDRSALRSDASLRSRPLRSGSNQSARRATATLASYAERATAVQGSSSSTAIRRDGTRRRTRSRRTAW